MPELKRKTIPIQTLIDAEIAHIEGKSISGTAQEAGVSLSKLRKVQEAVGAIKESNSPAMSIERQIISEAITDRLKPIKEELSLKSLEIIRMADEEMADRLSDESRRFMIKDKDILNISDTHSKRLARIVGLEEDPNAGGIDPNLRNKKVNIFIQNIFKGHNERLNNERAKINDTNPTPVYEDVENS